MGVDIKNPNRNDFSNTTPIIRSQRSSCAVVIYGYEDSDITRLTPLNVTNDKSLAAQAKQSAKNNLTSKPRPLVIRQDIIRCSITNNKGGNGGNFSLIVKRGKQLKSGTNTTENVKYVENVNPGDWIMIYMKKSGEISDSDLGSINSDSGLKFLGIVENVRVTESDDPGKGSPRLEVAITGRSFAKVFDTSVFFNPIVNQSVIQTVLGVNFLTDSSKTLKPLSRNTPDNVMKELIRFFLGNKLAQLSAANENWYVPQPLAQIFRGTERNKSAGRSFVDILDTSRIGLHSYDRKGNVKVTALPGVALIKALPSSGTIWSVMQFLQNSVVNEMYTELTNISGKLKPAVIHRQMPFSNFSKHETNVFAAHNKFNTKKTSDGIPDSKKTFFVNLPRHSIISSDIKNKNIGKSDHERVNYTIVVPKIDSSTFDIAFVAGSNPASVQRYGLKMLQGQTSYVLASASNTNSSKDGIKSYCEFCVNLMQDWFFLSHNLYNGTIIIDGTNDHIEVGNNLYIKDIKQLFHIEGYTHTYSVEPSTGSSSFETEIRISRGQIFDEASSKASFMGSSSRPDDTTTIITSFVQRNKEG